MTKELINTAHINAIKNKDQVAKALFSTFKGALDNELKNGSKKSEQEIIETIAKKFTENAKIMDTEESKLEIELLKPFMPQELELSSYHDTINNVIENNLETAEAIKAGNKQGMGKLLGIVMGKLKTNYPGFAINAEIVKENLNILLS